MAKATKKTTTSATKAKKTISKPEKVALTKAAKASKATKAAPAAKEVKEPAKGRKAPVKASEQKSLDVCLLLDETASMMSWIERSKETLKGIIANVKEDYNGLKVRVAFVGYRDIGDKPRFEVFQFSEDLDAAT